MANIPYSKALIITCHQKFTTVNTRHDPVTTASWPGVMAHLRPEDPACTAANNHERRNRCP
jgi:hypothetical protein